MTSNYSKSVDVYIILVHFCLAPVMFGSSNNILKVFPFLIQDYELDLSPLCIMDAVRGS